MKKFTVEVKTMNYQVNQLIGVKKEKIITVTQLMVEPDSEQEELDVLVRYHQARKDHLLNLQKLNSKINQLDLTVDKFNKVQISKLDRLSYIEWKYTVWYKKPFIDRRASKSVIESKLIKKDKLFQLIGRVDQLLKLLFNPTLTFPMKDEDYAMLCNIDYLVDHAERSYERLKDIIQRRQYNIP